MPIWRVTLYQYQIMLHPPDGSASEMLLLPFPQLLFSMFVLKCLFEWFRPKMSTTAHRSHTQWWLFETGGKEIQEKKMARKKSKKSGFILDIFLFQVAFHCCFRGGEVVSWLNLIGLNIPFITGKMHIPFAFKNSSWPRDKTRLQRISNG